jgi:hypothetical protein
MLFILPPFLCYSPSRSLLPFFAPSILSYHAPSSLIIPSFHSTSQLLLLQRHIKSSLILRPSSPSPPLFSNHLRFSLPFPNPCLFCYIRVEPPYSLIFSSYSRSLPHGFPSSMPFFQLHITLSSPITNF